MSMAAGMKENGPVIDLNGVQSREQPIIGEKSANSASQM